MAEYSYRYIPSINHVIGNITSIMTKDFISFFGDNYFKTVKVTTEVPHSERKKFKRNMVNWAKPMLVIEPVFDINEDSDFFPNIANQANNPIRFGGKKNIDLRELYGFIQRDNYTVYINSRRIVVNFRFHIITENESTQLNLASFLNTEIRHGAPHTLQKYLLNQIPESVMRDLSKLENIPYTDKASDQLLTLLNQHSSCPITNIIRGGSGLNEYFTLTKEAVFMKYGESLDLSLEMQQRLVRYAKLVEELRVEFSMVSKYTIITNEPITQTVSVPSDGTVFTFITGPMTIDEFIGTHKLQLKFRVSFDNSEDNVIDILKLIPDFEFSNIHSVMKNAFDLFLPLDFFTLRMFKDDKEITPLSFTNFKVTLNPLDIDLFSLYTVALYVDNDYINIFIDNKSNIYKK